MKSKIIRLLAIWMILICSNAKSADNSVQCQWRWEYGGGKAMRTWSVVPPALLNLRHTPVGSVMASSPIIFVHGEIWQISCSWPEVPIYRSSTFIDQLQMADGFTDVYKTVLPGVGIRFVSIDYTPGVVPMVYQYPNAGPTGTVVTNIINRMRIDFVRTSRDVTPGDINMDYTIHQNVSGWNAAEIKIRGITKLKSQTYFSGCSGIEKLNISMGRIPIVDLGAKQNYFNLDVLCSGLPAGTKVPVKVYFEGDSDGPGCLNLEPGGAQGVQILLVNDRGEKLPFSLGNALAMTWIRTEPLGEVYRLPVVAEYAKKASQKAVAGRANATLNYVLEYN